MIFNAGNLLNPYYTQFWGMKVGNVVGLLSKHQNHLGLPVTDSTAGAYSLAGTFGGGSKINHAIIDYDNGNMSVYLNGISIPNLKNYDVTGTVDIDDFNALLEFEHWVEKVVVNNTAVGKFVKALIIDTDGDVSDYTKEVEPDKPDEPDEPTIKELTTDGLIAYYDVGNESEWTSEGDISSKVTNDWTAYGGNVSAAGRYANRAKPTVFNEGYCQNTGGLAIFKPNGFSECEKISFEFVYSLTSTFANPSIRTAKKVSLSDSKSNYSSISPNNKMPMTSKKYNHCVVVLDNTGFVKIYINGILLDGVSYVGKDDALTCTFYSIGGDYNFLLGHVRVYNKELTQEEITNNYEWFVANAKVGQDALDADGNIIG